MFINRNNLSIGLKEEIPTSLMKIFGIFGLVNFPLLYILGASLLNEKPVALYLRSLGFIVCLFLALIEYWPSKLRRYQKLYWFAAITYSLPFFGTYMFIENGASSAWQVKITVGIFWLVLITNWLQFLIIFPLGVALAILTFNLISGQFHLEMNNVWGDLLNCVWAVVIAVFFAHRKEIIQHVKQQILKMQAGTIAHEMRTPLSTIGLMADNLKRQLPTLIHTQEKAQEKDKDIPHINQEILESLSSMPDRLKQVSRSSFTIIDMLLMNLKEDIHEAPPERCSILQCVEISINEYPLIEGDRNLIAIEIERDFDFKGNPVIIKHVIFNLMKNALYYVKDARKGKVRIWTEAGNKVNKLYFEDTSKGISKKHLPHIFDQFFSRTESGSGVGLAFCKMAMNKLGGDITCHSVQGEFTRFTLSFPVLQKENFPNAKERI